MPKRGTMDCDMIEIMAIESLVLQNHLLWKIDNSSINEQNCQNAHIYRCNMDKYDTSVFAERIFICFFV